MADVANQHANEARQCGLVLDWSAANAAQPLRGGGDRYRHFWAAGCTREAVRVPRVFFAPALRRGFSCQVYCSRRCWTDVNRGEASILWLMAKMFSAFSQSLRGLLHSPPDGAAHVRNPQAGGSPQPYSRIQVVPDREPVERAPMSRTRPEPPNFNQGLSRRYFNYFVCFGYCVYYPPCP
jgi:hypothetical protein